MVLAPTSSYNLILLQLLIWKIKQQWFQLGEVHQDDISFQLKVKQAQSNTPKTMTTTTTHNDLFFIDNCPSFHVFFGHTGKYNPHYNLFAGVTNIIEGGTSTLIPPTSFCKECPQAHEKPMPILFCDCNFQQPLNNQPQHTPLSALDKMPQHQSPELLFYCQKQRRLTTLYGRYGHISYTIIKMLCLANLLPR